MGTLLRDVFKVASRSRKIVLNERFKFCPVVLKLVKNLLAGKEITAWEEDKREKGTDILKRKAEESSKAFTSKFENNH